MFGKNDLQLNLKKKDWAWLKPGVIYTLPTISRVLSGKSDKNPYKGNIGL